MAEELDFTALYRDYGLDDGGPQDLPKVTRLSDAMGDAGEAGRLLSYLWSLGSNPVDLDALYHTIIELDAEEELSAFRCRQGVAVTHASDGWWILFIDDASPD